MIINLTDKDGLLLAQWNIEEEFGDIEQQFPRSEMTLAILDEYRRLKKRESEPKVWSLLRRNPPELGGSQGDTSKGEADE